ncbi:membrane protein [Gordonia phage Camerico]|nr:membrane protein [Gordonia phage Camerico]
MFKKIATGILSTVAAGAMFFAGSGAASAVEISPYSYAKVVFCSDNRYGNEVSYYDDYGLVEETVRLDNHVGGSRYCGSPARVWSGEYGDYTWASISNDNSPYVYCAIYDDGVLVSRSADNDSYGYVWAMCS